MNRDWVAPHSLFREGFTRIVDESEMWLTVAYNFALAVFSDPVSPRRSDGYLDLRNPRNRLADDLATLLWNYFEADVVAHVRYRFEAAD